MAFVAFAGLSLIPSFHRLVATLIVSDIWPVLRLPCWCRGGGRDAAWGFWVSPFASSSALWRVVGTSGRCAGVCGGIVGSASMKA